MNTNQMLKTVQQACTRTHMPHTAALSPETTRMLGSDPVAAPARALLARASAQPFGNSFACARSFQDHASHTATFLSSPAEGQISECALQQTKEHYS